MQLDPQLTGNVGLYYCCYHLSLLGWNVIYEIELRTNEGGADFEV